MSQLLFTMNRYVHTSPKLKIIWIGVVISAGALAGIWRSMDAGQPDDSDWATVKEPGYATTVIMNGAISAPAAPSYARIDHSSLMLPDLQSEPDPGPRAIAAYEGSPS